MFSELVENKGLICLKVRKSARQRKSGIENKRVSGRGMRIFWGVLEVVANKRGCGNPGLGRGVARCGHAAGSQAINRAIHTIKPNVIRSTL
jgi:hypothetical protein